MLLIILMGLIAKLTLVSGDNDENFFNWNQVVISVLARILRQAAFKSVDSDLYLICDSINDFSVQHIRLHVQRNKLILGKNLLMI